MKAILVVAIIATLLIGCGKKDDKSPEPSVSNPKQFENSNPKQSDSSNYCSEAFMSDMCSYIVKSILLSKKFTNATKNKDKNSCINYGTALITACRNFVNKYGKDFSCTSKIDNEIIFMNDFDKVCNEMEEYFKTISEIYNAT